jgi:hypothetical protein
MRAGGKTAGPLPAKSTEAGMRVWLDDNPQGKFGLSPERLRPRFERYLSEYAVEPEG